MSKCEGCRKYEDCATGSGLTWPCGAYVPREERVTEMTVDFCRKWSVEECRMFLDAAKKRKTEYCEEHGLPVPAFDKVEDFYIEAGMTSGHKTAEVDTEANHAPEILMFIGRFSNDGWGTRWEVVEAFTRGCCFWFAYILAARFGQEYGAEIVTDYVANHFATRIAGRVYDITGDVTDTGTWEPWAECSDDRLREQITQDCIMF